jgi:glycosyltransferase involved in cell wall biosynthesis
VRILVVTPWYPTAEAPQLGLFVAREAAALAEVHDVRVLHLDWTGPVHATTVAVDGVDARRVVLRRSRPVDFARARRLVRRAAVDADVVHTHALTALIPWLAGRPTTRPWVHSEHWSALTAPETLGRGQRLALRALRPMLDRPDVVVAESERLAAAVRNRRTGPVEIVPCVVPTAALVPRPAAGLPLVAVGGLVDRKDPLLAVDVLALLCERGHDASLTWVGEGPLRDV